MSKPIQYEYGADKGSTRWGGTAPTSYELHFLDCNDEKKAQRIEEPINSMVAGFARIFDVERLHGITIANDYRALIERVDRGSANPSPVEIYSEKAGLGFGRTVLITGLDDLRVRILLSDAVSQALISDSRDKASWGTHVLATQLASVAWIGLVEKTVPGGILAPIEDRVDGWLYGNVHEAIAGYVMSQMAAAFGNAREITTGLRELLVEGLNSMETEVPKARRAYKWNGNMEKLLAVVLPAVQKVLTFAAKLLGHCSLTNESPFDEPGVLKGRSRKREAYDLVQPVPGPP